jgi:hypothetical protein
MLLVAATLGAQPAAPAAAPAMTVYEVTRTSGARWRGDLDVYVFTHSDGEPGVMSSMQLAPRKGGGWSRERFMVGMYNPFDTRVAVYGGGAVTPTPCSDVTAVCGDAPSRHDTVWRARFRPAPGHRYFVAGVTGMFGVYVPPGWNLRRSSLAARAVHTRSEPVTAAGAVGADRRVEVLQSVTAPAGRYGSGVFARVPCDDKDGESFGSATLRSDGSDKAVAISCDPEYYGFSGTSNGRTWTLSGPVVGEYEFSLRLFVFDYPKR